jgi:probable HAF family extracellular repeat protein
VATYTFSTIDDPLGFGTEVFGINDNGLIVGTYFGIALPHGFVTPAGTGTYLTLDDPLGITGTDAFGINTHNSQNVTAVVGAYNDGSRNSHGFITAASTAPYFTLDDPLGTHGTVAYGINNADQVVGFYVDSSFGRHGFLYNGTGSPYITLDDPLATQGTEAHGINDAGQIVGDYLDSSGTTHGFLYSAGTYTTLDDPLGISTVASGINDAGQIVGTYLDSSFTHHGFLYSNGTYTTIDDALGTKGTLATGINDAGQIVGYYFDSSNTQHGFLANPVTATTIQNDYLAITRTALSLDQATTVINSIIAGTQTITQYVDGLLSHVANTTIPAVVVEASMYGATGTSAEITSLVVDFLPAQVANATSHGLNPQVYACEVLGLVFAFGNETGSTSFATNFGPLNSMMPNTTAGDAAFAVAASNAINGSASMANLVDVMISTWKAFYTAHGLPGSVTPTADQIDLAARGAAWGDMVGVALANDLGPLLSQTVNFLADAVQGTAVYGASLVGQPAHQPFV